MFFEVSSLTYHSAITIESLTYCVLLGVRQYSSRRAIPIAGDGNVTVQTPEILLYEPLPNERLRLTGGDYLVEWSRTRNRNTRVPGTHGTALSIVRQPNRFGKTFYALQVCAWKDKSERHIQELSASEVDLSNLPGNWTGRFTKILTQFGRSITPTDINEHARSTGTVGREGLMYDVNVGDSPQSFWGSPARPS